MYPANKMPVMAEKQKEQDLIDSHKAAFIARGGKIEILTGFHNANPYTRSYNESLVGAS